MAEGEIRIADMTASSGLTNDDNFVVDKAGSNGTKKFSASDYIANKTELVDIRVGADGTHYDSAGNAVRGQFSVLKRNIEDITNIDIPISDRTTWSNKRVNTEGELVNSPSQLTTDDILYIGKGKILKIEHDNSSRQVSISYYQNNTYIRSDVYAIRQTKYIYIKYDYVRISFVGTSSNPPLLNEFDVNIFNCLNDEFVDKNIAFLGDSITTFKNISETNDSYNAPYYPTSDIEYYEQTYAKMFFDACGGSEISVSAISNSSWRNQGNNACPSAYEDVRIQRLSLKGNPDYIFINMGTNDPYSSNIGDTLQLTYDVNALAENTVYTVNSIQLTIRKIQVTYPNAKIILIIPKFASAIGSGNYTFEKWEKVCNFITEVANLYGVYKVIDLRKCGITVDTFSTDCISSAMHPNFNGMKKMGKYMIKELLL